jgi:anti-anti-sigma factor
MIDSQPHDGSSIGGGPSIGGGLSRAVLLDCAIVITNETITVALYGEVDVVTAPLLHTVLTAFIAPGRIVVVDTVELRFCSVRGLAVLLEAGRQARSWQAQLRVVIAPGSSLARAWSMIGQVGVPPSYPDRQATATGPPVPARPLPRHRSVTDFGDLPSPARTAILRILHGERS